MQDLRTSFEERIKVFVPHARLLTGEEITRLPREDLAGASGEGVWLEIPCPDRQCVIGEGRIALEVTCAREEESEGLWTRLFCPEKSCYAEQATDLPS